MNLSLNAVKYTWSFKAKKMSQYLKRKVKITQPYTLFFVRTINKVDSDENEILILNSTSVDAFIFF